MTTVEQPALACTFSTPEQAFVLAPMGALAHRRSTATWRGKRIFDVAGAILLLVVFAPLMLILAMAVKVTSPGPVLFKQQRVGRHGRRFTVLKFRTMTADAEERLLRDDELRTLYLSGSHKIACDLDPRLTRLGRRLRTWSVDELPQLLNVLAGHMSLVGPRPVTEQQLVEYGDRLDAYLDVKPGLTGLWQVSGRNLVKFPARAELDADYRDRCSLGLDMRIIARTPLAVALRHGAE